MGNMSEFQYPLSDDQIAKFPLAERDQAKLLVWENQTIQHRIFHELPELIKPGTRLFFNDTRVIPARIEFRKTTGAIIEVFLLQPVLPSTEVNVVMNTSNRCAWQCVIGNSKRWPVGLTLIHPSGLTASLKEGHPGLVTFEWKKGSFSEILQLTGETPLPPYLNRKAVDSDRDRYQTVYSKNDGAVAAPTAGLHFTPKLLDALQKKGIQSSYLTLHVSAGTFLPVKAENFADHRIHSEQFIVTKSLLLEIIESESRIAVGTTSLRTLESLYWLGLIYLETGKYNGTLSQEEPYKPRETYPTMQEVCTALLRHLDSTGKTALAGETSIYIMPGYTIRSVKGLITNFHQPGSTLILLVAAVTKNNWRAIYETARQENYRFLSFGDSSLLMI